MGQLENATRWPIFDIIPNLSRGLLGNLYATMVISRRVRVRIARFVSDV
jgi:hypothetical protein